MRRCIDEEVVDTRNQPTIRLATTADVARCGRICFEAFAATCRQHGFAPDFRTVAEASALWRVLVRHPNVFTIVAEVDGDVVGCNALDERSEVFAVGPLTVDPDVQNRGLGRVLMNAVLERSALRNARGVRLMQAAHHGRALALYSTLGFAFREEFAMLEGGASNGGTDRSVRLATADDQPACDSLCETAHGFSRHEELADAIAAGSAMVVEHRSGVAGYATEVGFFGHAVADTAADVQSLIAGVPRVGPPGLLVPLRDGATLGWSLKRGLRIAYTMNLMTMGFYQEPTRPYLASGGF